MFSPTSTITSTNISSKKTFTNRISLKMFLLFCNLKRKWFSSLTFKTLHSDPLQNHTDSKLSYLQSIVNPLPLINALKINIYEQEDAEELLLNLINKVDESLGTSSSLASQTNGKASKSSVKSIPPPSNEPVLLPSDVFQCQLNQFIYAMDHDHYLSSNKTLKYFDLSISIDNQQIINHGKMKNHQNSLPLIHLNDCIHNFFQPEYFIGNNQYKCNKYGYINAKKILKIISFPKILIIHLKRFSFDPNTYQMKKVTTPVEIPATLDLSQYAMKAQDFATVKEKEEEEEARKKGESTENEKVHTHSHSSEFFPNTISPTNNVGRYSLSAAVIHQGSIDRGHYFTLAKVAKHPNITDEDKMHHWVMLNDHQVTPLDEETVLKIARGEERSSSNGGSRSIYEKVLGSDPVSSNAYLLFYTLQE
eukprot:gene13039-14303_t